MTHRTAGQFVQRRAEPPYAIDRFFGRERELGELRELIDRVRLLTLIGPPGVGKSRLATELVQRTAAGGAAYVDLSLAASSTELLGVIGPALGFDQPATSFRQLAAAIETDHLVLILDNCSRVEPAGAELTMTLLSHCPNLCIVATSRERLGVPGETLWQVLPLAAPEPGSDLAAVASSEAVVLLVERMFESAPRFRLDEGTAAAIATICQRVDGLPLALELAASWIPALTPGEIAERLERPLSFLDRGRRGAPARHQSMRAAIEWTTAVLSETEARLLRRLAIFAGSWDLDAARAIVADETLLVELVLPTLANLAGKSLVQVQTRAGQPTASYRLLHVIRDHAREQLEVSGERDSVSQRHAVWYARQLEATSADKGGDARDLWLRREQHNLQVVLDWAIERDDADLAMRVASGLQQLWYTSGRYAEARAWLARVLAIPALLPRQRTWVASWAIPPALSEGDFAAAVNLAEMARELAALPDSSDLQVLALDGWASIQLERGDVSQAAEVLTAERALIDGLEQAPQLASVHQRLANISIERGDLTTAEEQCAAALAIVGRTGHLWIRVRIERTLGRIAFQRGQTDTAVSMFEALLSRMREADDARGTVLTLLDLALALQARRHLARARQLVRDALLLAGLLREPLVIARALDSAAGLLASARPDGCVQIAAAAAQVRGGLGVAALPLERSYVERAVRVARTRLSPGASVIAAASGEILTRERAIRLAADLLDSLEGLSGVGGPPADSLLTPREQAVAVLVQQGLTNRAIAQSLTISEGTVRAHVEHILNKLGVRSRTDIGERLRT